MPVRTRILDTARSRARAARVEAGAEIRRSRMASGLPLRVGSYPGERAIVDAPQLELLRRFQARIGAAWGWQFEVPTPIAGDRRAADAVIRNGRATIVVEAFTRLADAQAQ